MKETQTYVLFLRGINVGGNTLVKMDSLKEALLSLGLLRIKTLLNSGNVVFDSPEKDMAVLQKSITDKLLETFGFSIAVVIRTRQDIEDLVAHNPFRSITVTPETRLYVTFLTTEPKGTLPIPYESSDKNFRILEVENNIVSSVLVLTPARKTTEVMKIIEQEFGKAVTTRNWNTIAKIATVLE